MWIPWQFYIPTRSRYQPKFAKHVDNFTLEMSVVNGQALTSFIFFLPGQSNVEFTSYSISFNSSDLTRLPKYPNTHYLQNLIERGSVAYLTMIFRCALKQWKFCALLWALTVSFSSYLKRWWGGFFRYILVDFTIKRGEKPISINTSKMVNNSDNWSSCVSHQNMIQYILK